MSNPQYRLLVLTRGTVQGEGFRPTVFRLAKKAGVSGRVKNVVNGTEIEIWGVTPREVRRKWTRLRAQLREIFLELIVVRQRILPMDSLTPGASGFQIASSETGKTGLPALAVDRALCEECWREYTGAVKNRRAGYGLIACVRCGPRYGIARRMPWGRERTSLAEFPACPVCEQEYQETTDRRFHSENIACPECGPWWSFYNNINHRQSTPGELLTLAARAFIQENILAVKSMGGYQLWAPVDNPPALERLRQFKSRPVKPLAVLCADLETADKIGYLDAASRQDLLSPARPIVVVPALQNAGLAAAVLSGLDFVGLFLPGEALTRELVKNLPGKQAVVTSANIKGCPMALTRRELARQWNGFWGELPKTLPVLSHNRRITGRSDDSLTRVTRNNQRLILRAGRGLAPVSLELRGGKLPPVLGVGGHLKSSLCLGQEYSIISGPYIGNLDSLEMERAWWKAVHHWLDLSGLKPEFIVHDLHPDYATTRLARQLADELGARTQAVQHHQAHALALLADNDFRPGRDLVCAVFDGHGYGGDGTLWGGEFLRACLGGEESVQPNRLGFIRGFPLPGGTAAIREPARLALWFSRQWLSEKDWETFLAERNIPAALARQWLALADNTSLSPRTSSVGRLFDVVAWILSLVDRIDFEGQAGLKLEGLFTGKGLRPEKPVRSSIRQMGEQSVLDPVVLLRAVWEKRREPDKAVSLFFHTLVEWMLVMARERGANQLGVTGGVFQNRSLLELLLERAGKFGVRVYCHQRFSPGDGALSAGQILGMLEI